MRRAAMVVIVGLLAGCGGGDSAGEDPAAQVEAAVKGYAGALVGRDGGKACGFMTRELQGSMLDAMRTDPQAKALIAGKGCAETLDFIFKATKGSETIESALAAVDKIEVADVKVSGNKADARWTMQVEGQKLDQPAKLERVGDRWLVSCCLGPG